MAHRKSLARIAKAAYAAHLRAQGAKNLAPPVTGLSWDQLADLQSRITGRIVLPGDPDYNQDRQESNPAFQSYPQVIVYCANETDVAQCLYFAQMGRLQVAVRSGGHSTAGYSVNNGMVIDVSMLNSVMLDPVNALVNVGAGSDFDHFNGVMNGTGWHVPTGACGSVCIGGFVQGGGYGYTSRKFGIQSDCVNAFRVMLADGSIATASATENSDLFWAMRGGTGGNFGVLLQVTYNMAPLDKLWAFAISWSEPYAAQVLTLMQQQYMRTGPDALGYMMNLGIYRGQPVYMVQGMYVGTAAEGKQALAPLLTIPTAQLLVDTTGTYPQMDVYLEDNPYSLPDNLPDGICETKASGYIATPLSQADWQTIIDYYKTSPNPWSLAYTEPYGGAINRYPVADSAFIHRNVDCDLVVDVFWRDQNERQVMEAWLDGFMALLAPFMNGHVYQNYCDGRLADFRTAYWGDAFDKLLQVKQKYDPSNFFCYPQSITPR